MRTWRKATVVAAVCVLPAVYAIATTTVAGAHGTMSTPPSRIYTCFLEGPEHPQSAACRAAVAQGGTQPLYDWNEVNIANAAGNHRQVIPDGRLCSANRDKYAAFDAPRSDWRTTTIPRSGSFTFLFRATAPHRGSFDLYVTRTGWNPTAPLKWSDLEATPFLHVVDPPLVDGSYRMPATLPSGKTGRHLIYTIWQRSDSPEAFYTCTDVVFGTATATPSPTRTTSPTAPPTTTPPTTPPPTTQPPTTPPPGGFPAWKPNTAYATGARVSYAGLNYECRQGHTSLTGWEPPNTPALWLRI